METRTEGCRFQWWLHQVSGIIQNSKGTLHEQIHRARDTQKNFSFFFFFWPFVSTRSHTFSLEEFLFRITSSSTFSSLFTIFSYRLSSSFFLIFSSFYKFNKWFDIPENLEKTKLSVRRKEYVRIYFEMIRMQIEGHRSRSYLFKGKFKKYCTNVGSRRKRKKERRTSNTSYLFSLQLASIITITAISWSFELTCHIEEKFQWHR